MSVSDRRGLPSKALHALCVGVAMVIAACTPDAVVPGQPPEASAAVLDAVAPEPSPEAPAMVPGIVETTGAERAVILIYHHVADDTPPSTSVTVEQFTQHLAILARDEYAVVPLADIVQWRRGGTLPGGAVAITFDDAWKSVLHHAVPLLEQRGWPFTVFANTDAVDAGYSKTMTWDELRSLTKRGGTIANHSAGHAHLLQLTDQVGINAARADILKARERITKEIGEGGAGDWIAWPYGEFDHALTHWLESMGFIGFGQQSGPVGRSSPLGLLPRFPTTGSAATEDAFVLRLNTHPLPIKEIPRRWRLHHDDPAPELRLSIEDANIARELSCYNARGQTLDVAHEADTVLVRSPTPLATGRNKYTCTAPNRHEPGTWYWYSHPWFRPTQTGTFPD